MDRSGDMRRYLSRRVRHNYSGKRFARVFNATSSHRAARSERRDKCERDDAPDETRHSI